MFYGPTKSKRELSRNVPGIVSSRLLQRNTMEWVDSAGRKHIRLHNTDVLVFDGDTVTLNSGGYLTVTTKDRINNNLPKDISVYSDKGIWRVQHRRVIERRDGSWHRKVYWDVPYYDGMVIHGHRRPDDEQGKATEARAKVLKKKIAKFLKHIKGMEKLPVPGLGDCLICRLHQQDCVERKPAPDYDCIEGHLDELYVHGSLIYNALRWAGYRDEQMPFVFQMKETVIRSMRKLLKARLGLV